MRCAWDQLLRILPTTVRADVDRLGCNTLQELRLRVGGHPQLVLGGESGWLSCITNDAELAFVVNAASRYSPWSAATAAQGYLTAPGGHRIGMCGEAVISRGEMTGIRHVSSLCIRVARDFPGIAEKLRALQGNILILGPPGSGKTTLLRDLIRQIADMGSGSIAVVDERGELFPDGFARGRTTDVMTGCSKYRGLETALRTMGPSCIAMDEITAQEDCQALSQALWCGVRLIATAHASCMQDLLTRPVYAPIRESGCFDTVVILQRDKSWRTERMAKWN